LTTGFEKAALESRDFLTKGSVLRAGGAKLRANSINERIALCDITFKSGDVLCGK